MTCDISNTAKFLHPSATAFTPSSVTSASPCDERSEVAWEVVCFRRKKKRKGKAN